MEEMAGTDPKDFGKRQPGEINSYEKHNKEKQMALKEVSFSGKFKWFRPTTKNKFDKYTVDFYPVDRKEFKALGLKNEMREDDDGFYFRLASPNPIKVVDPAGEPVTKLIGNGSAGTVNLVVESFVSPKYGNCTRSFVESAVIEELLEYVKPEETSEVAQAAAGPAADVAPAASRKPMPF